MNYGELKKRADEHRGWKAGKVPEGRDKFWGRFSVWVEEGRAADTAFTEHCRTHFDEAVVALRRERDSLVNPKAKRLSLAEIEALIAKLEDVK